jgi:hypothetical protein
MSSQILNRPLKDLNLLISIANQDVALVMNDASDLAGCMTMIDVRSSSIHPKRVFANWTKAFLVHNQLIIAFRGQAIALVIRFSLVSKGPSGSTVIL